MKTFFIILGFISFFTYLSAQNTDSNNNRFDFKKTKIAEKIQLEVGPDFRFVSFYIKGIKNATQRQALAHFFNSNPNFKKVSIASYNEFHGFIKKSVHAPEVQKMLQSQGVDMVISPDKFIFSDIHCILPHQSKK